MLSRSQDDPESLYAAGVYDAVQQLRDLIEGGADGVHLYAMNDAKVAAAVYEGIKDLLQSVCWPHRGGVKRCALSLPAK